MITLMIGAIIAYLIGKGLLDQVYSDDTAKPSYTDPIFKEDFDRDMWDLGMGTDQVRVWIYKLNKIYIDVTGRPMIVTSWYRPEDLNSRHRDGSVFDARRNSSANYLSYDPISIEDFLIIEQRAYDLLIPIVVHSSGTSNDHFHVG